MSKEIKVGDLVCVEKGCPHCGNPTGIGIVFKVSAIIDDRNDWECGKCWKKVKGPYATDCHPNDCVPTMRLRRIDPPASGEYAGVAVRRKQPVKELA